MKNIAAVEEFIEDWTRWTKLLVWLSVNLNMGPLGVSVVSVYIGFKSAVKSAPERAS